MKKKMSRLAIRFVIGLLFLSISIWGISAFVCSNIFSSIQADFAERYLSESMPVIFETVDELDQDVISPCIDLINQRFGTEDEAEIEEIRSAMNTYGESEAYQKTQKQWDDLREQLDAEYLELFYLLDSESLNDPDLEEPFLINYIFLSEKNSELEMSGLRYCSEIEPMYAEDFKQIVFEGKLSQGIEILESGRGVGATYAETLRNGEQIIIDVGVPVQKMDEQLELYQVGIRIILPIMMAVVILLYMVILFRRVIRPINQISQEANSFIENGAKKSKLLEKIKTKDEIQYLAQSVLKMETDIDHYIQDITSITAERERIGAELDVAKRIQESMLPSTFPAIPDRKEFDIFASMTPAKEVGGDFYDFFLIDNDHLAMVVADVSGKGVPAAMFMMISKTLIKSAAQSGMSPKAVMEKVNNQLCENNKEEMFVTVWLGILEVSTGKMTCANAGHEYPAIYRAGEAFEIYRDKHDFVLAGMEDMIYREYVIQLGKGDMIYMYTDGVQEAINEKEELYGEDRMIRALNSCPDQDLEKLDQFVREDINKFVGAADQFDDITMLCMKYNGSQAENSQS